MQMDPQQWATHIGVSHTDRNAGINAMKSYFWQIFPHRPETQKLLNESDITKQATEKEKKILGESQSREEYKQKMEDALRRLQGVSAQMQQLQQARQQQQAGMDPAALQRQQQLQQIQQQQQQQHQQPQRQVMPGSMHQIQPPNLNRPAQSQMPHQYHLPQQQQQPQQQQMIKLQQQQQQNLQMQQGAPKPTQYPMLPLQTAVPGAPKVAPQIPAQPDENDPNMLFQRLRQQVSGLEAMLGWAKSALAADKFQQIDARIKAAIAYAKNPPPVYDVNVIAAVRTALNFYDQANKLRQNQAQQAAQQQHQQFVQQGGPSHGLPPQSAPQLPLQQPPASLNYPPTQGTPKVNMAPAAAAPKLSFVGARAPKAGVKQTVGKQVASVPPAPVLATAQGAQMANATTHNGIPVGNVPMISQPVAAGVMANQQAAFIAAAAKVSPQHVQQLQQKQQQLAQQQQAAAQAAKMSGAVVATPAGAAGQSQQQSGTTVSGPVNAVVAGQQPPRPSAAEVVKALLAEANHGAPESLKEFLKVNKVTTGRGLLGQREGVALEILYSFVDEDKRPGFFWWEANSRRKKRSRMEMTSPLKSDTEITIVVAPIRSMITPLAKKAKTGNSAWEIMESIREELVLLTSNDMFFKPLIEDAGKCILSKFQGNQKLILDFQPITASSVVNQSSQLRVVFPKVSVENCIFPEMFLSQTKPLIDRCAGGPLQLLQSILELWKTHLNAESTISRELSHPGLAALNVTYSEATFASKSFIKFSAGKRPELFICVPSAYPHASVDQYMVKVPQSDSVLQERKLKLDSAIKSLPQKTLAKVLELWWRAFA